MIYRFHQESIDLLNGTKRNASVLCRSCAWKRTAAADAFVNGWLQTARRYYLMHYEWFMNDHGVGYVACFCKNHRFSSVYRFRERHSRHVDFRSEPEEFRKRRYVCYAAYAILVSQYSTFVLKYASTVILIFGIPADWTTSHRFGFFD